MSLEIVPGMAVHDWVADDAQYASCLYLLATQWPDVRLTSRLQLGPDRVVSIDVYGLLDEGTWSSSERLTVRIALGMYGAVVEGDSLGLAAGYLNRAQMDRVLRALAIRRGHLALLDAIGTPARVRALEAARALHNYADALLAEDDSAAAGLIAKDLLIQAQALRQLALAEREPTPAGR